MTEFEKEKQHWLIHKVVTETINYFSDNYTA